MTEKMLVVFDLDGTLIDAYAAITQSFNFTMRSLGYPEKSPGFIRRSVGWGDENLLKSFVEPKHLREALSVYRRHHRKALLRKSRLFPGAQRVLSFLKRKGYKLGVASNRPTVFSLLLLKHLGIKRYFDIVLCKDKVTFGKPHPEILRTIMRRLSFTKQQTVFVGDMVIDAQAGRRSGVRTIMVTTGSSSLSAIRREKPFKIIRAISQVKDIL